MKAKLILLAEPILVVYKEEADLIIAGIAELPSITYSDEALEVLEKKYGWVDIELVSKTISSSPRSHWEIKRAGFVEGFKKAQSLNEKKFSEEEIIKAYEAGEDAGYVRGSDGRDDSKFLSIEELLQSLSQPKEVDVEIEMGLMRLNSDGVEIGFPDMNQPKITNNSIKVTKVL